MEEVDMNVLQRLLNRLENRGVYDAKNRVTPEIIMIQVKAKQAKEQAENTAKQMRGLEKELKKLTAYKVAIATGRIN